MARENWYERLSPTDAMFLDIEDDRAHMHVGGVFVYQGRPPPYRDFADYIESRLDQVPRYRQRLAFPPLGIGRPVWVDDDGFDIEHHARHSALPAPGGEAALKRALGRIFSRPLDHDRPLWQLELVEGVGEDRFAVVSRTHHSVLDGIVGNDVIAAITDGEPIFSIAGFPSEWEPRPAPSRVALLAASIRDEIAAPVRLVREAIRSRADLRRVAAQAREAVQAMARLGWNGRAPDLCLNAVVGPHRRYEMTSVDLGAVKRVRSQLGATVNDVILAMVAAATRALLTARGERLRDVRVFVPVNVRPPDAQHTMGNQVGVVYCPLPIGEADPVTRLRRIADEMTRIKDRNDAAASVAVAQLGVLAPPPVARAAARLEIAYRRFNFVVSNVPGSPKPRYFLGRRLLAFHPLIPLSRQQLLSVGLHTYCDQVCFGIAADEDRVRDLAVFAQALPAALDELLAAAGAGAPAPARERAVSEPVPQVPMTGAAPAETPVPERRA